MNAESLPLIAIEPDQPEGKPTCGELNSADGRRLPLKALTIDTVIVGLTATSTVRQRFVNIGDTTIEASYVFPLPARAGVTEFAASLAGRRVLGVLKERGQARDDYEQALSAGQRAAIVEEDRSDVFSVRVGNLGPGEEATIEMRLTGPLEYEDGEASFRFPLVVAPRYTAGSPLPGDRTGAGMAPDTDAVPDASRVTPPRLTDHDVRPEVRVTISLDSGGLSVSELRSSLPTTVQRPSADGVTRLRVAPGARADRDLVLRFRVDRDQLSSSALLVPDAERTAASPAAEGTWSLTLVPPAEPSSAARDVVVVLDRSGSMAGWKMVAARRTAGRIVDMLDAGDRFCVLAFDDRIDTSPAMPDGLVEACDRNRFAAASWLGSLRSRGGTVMAQPLSKAVELLAESSAERQASVVLVTDGQISGEDHLLRSLAPGVGRTRIYCVGVDRAVNAGFLERLAGLGSGRAELVESEDRLDEVMARLARTIGRPALTSVRVRAEGFEIIEDTITPDRVPDAFAGVPCVISGRYRGAAANAKLYVDADGATGRFTATVPTRLVPDALAVQTIWARSVVRDLEDAYASGRGADELAQRLVAHSIRYGVLSRFTAFVAIDPEHTEAGPITEVVQPVEPPSGWAPLAGGFVGAAAGAALARGGVAGRPMAFPAAAPVPPLRDLLRRVAMGIGGDGAELDPELDEVWSALSVHRDRAPDSVLASALAVLCEALNRYLCTATKQNADRVRAALDEVKRIVDAQHPKHRVRLVNKLRFWE
ncbi:marine proteobacterial sortase target protein [Mycobacterium basiliense]|uniref:Marine proteobacterial sortase target protein n=1 Tax=Mycobacterium basiliense TaxID=2094119 RepID=A0A3S4FKY4_9MYCO|nr:VIT domain-containing protein [Mycobacterium basiliense]VDM87512.1 marine proteobacterial sortase target protein [Mycobacterium basiliense]